jgi:glycerophosphoryl diester phosphodiesterase
MPAIKLTLSLIIVVVMAALTGCSKHNILLQAPELRDEVIAFNAGFYTVHSVDDGQELDDLAKTFVGKLVYLYKDQYFVDGNLFTGLRGAFLPDNYIASQLVGSKIEHYWYNIESKEKLGTITIDDVLDNQIHMHARDNKGAEERLILRYYSKQLWKPDIGTIYIAHRGSSYQPPANDQGIYPANTMPAFESALQAGFEGFELDVRITRDLRFLVSHDENLNVATTTRGYVHEKNLEELKDVLVLKSAFIPEKKSTAANAYIAAPIVSLKDVLDRYLDDPRVKTIVVDIKPDTDENIITAATYDFNSIDTEYQQKILFLTRSAGSAAGLKKLVPGADIALEGSLGVEPLDEEEWPKYYPQAAGNPRGSHNTISFSANLVLAFDSEETIRDKLNKLEEMNAKYEYKTCLWTITNDWRLNFLRENNYIPEYLLTDASYYQIGLQQLRYNQGKDVKFPIKRAWVAKEDIYPVYHDLLNTHVIDFWFESRHMLQVSYGIGTPKHVDFQNEFAPVGNWEFKYGRSEINKFSKTNVELNDRYLFASFLNSSNQPKNLSEDQIRTNSFRFGIGTHDGIGYGGSDFATILFVSQAFVWTRLNSFSDSLLPEEGEEPSNDLNILDRYGGVFRFGDRAAYGLKMEITARTQLNINFETAVVYPRHLFWYWAGSFILAEAGYGLLTTFADDFVNSRPVFGPVINLILKSAYLYGYYALRKDDMNWPFSTEAPLRYETFNLGISFVF